MNVKPPSLFDIAHYMNLALLPRHHSYQTTVLCVSGNEVKIERHGGKPPTATATCGALELHCDSTTWIVREAGVTLIETNVPIRALDTFWRAVRVPVPVAF